MSLQLSRLIAATLLMVACFSAPASAQFIVCNKTPAPISVAIAFETQQDIVSQGWWTIDPDGCSTVISTPLDKPYYYHYVVSNALKYEWRGTYNFCTIEDPQFRITGSQDCEGRSFSTTGFRQTDVGTNKEYTLNVRAGPPPAAGTPPIVAPAPAPAAPAPDAPAPAAPAPAAPAPAAPAPAAEVPTPAPAAQ